MKNKNNIIIQKNDRVLMIYFFGLFLLMQVELL